MGYFIVSFFFTKSSKFGTYFTLIIFQLKTSHISSAQQPKVTGGQHTVRIYEERNEKHSKQASLLSGW